MTNVLIGEDEEDWELEPRRLIPLLPGKKAKPMQTRCGRDHSQSTRD